MMNSLEDQSEGFEYFSEDEVSVVDVFTSSCWAARAERERSARDCTDFCARPATQTHAHARVTELKMKLSELFCITVLVSSGSGAPHYDRKEKRVQYAPWEDVNVLAHGLLQLGQSLKEHVDRTRGQMREATVKLAVVNGSVSELRAATQHLHADTAELRARAQRLEEREGRILNVTAALQEKLEKSASGNHSDARAVQLLLETQNKRIDELVERIKLQQEKLDKQNLRIRTLQNQIQMKTEPSVSSSDEAPALMDQRDAPAVTTASNCHELFLRGETKRGLYTLQPSDSQPIDVYCEMTSEAGWTLIQRRQDGSVDFDQLWDDYRNGFGNLNGEFWLGLEKIHRLTRDGDYILRIQMSDWLDEHRAVQYRFRLAGEKQNYSLRILESPAGNLESALSSESSSGLPFSTRDRDNDQKLDLNCAKHLSGGWWFSNCGRSNLNGRYFITPPKQRHERKQGAFWKTWHSRYYPLKSTTMMITSAQTQNES
ncbi:angiopoietin-related protein 4 [Trichomycterus rosablanca]|uniref:angiopoietin-related protein 4 n=1 Tax=Trichomycterus rosablanca TaxID=2290929 RepID=UPI002F360332